MNDNERRKAGLIYDPMNALDKNRNRFGALMLDYNRSFSKGTQKKLEADLFELFNSVGKGTSMIPPIQCTFTQDITIGSGVFIDMDFIAQGDGTITIQDRVRIGPRVSIYTQVFPYDPVVRASGLRKALPVTIGEDVYIGGSVVINPGVTIGAGSVIAPGSVVTKDIQENSFAAGVPAEVIRTIGEQDKEDWTAQRNAYLVDPDTED